MRKPIVSGMFAEAIVGIPSEGTLQIPNPEGGDVVRFLRFSFTGRRAWPYIYFHWAPDEHSFLSLN